MTLNYRFPIGRSHRTNSLEGCTDGGETSGGARRRHWEPRGLPCLQQGAPAVNGDSPGAGPRRVSRKPSSLLGDGSEPTARPYKAHPRDPVLGDQYGPSCHPAGEQTVQSTPQGCSAELFKGWDPKTRITSQNPNRLTRERCSGRTEKRRAPCVQE